MVPGPNVYTRLDPPAATMGTNGGILYLPVCSCREMAPRGRGVAIAFPGSAPITYKKQTVFSDMNPYRIRGTGGFVSEVTHGSKCSGLAPPHPLCEKWMGC